MLAPCITVLSTSKNAAAVGSSGVVERGLHLGGRGRRLAGQGRALLQVARSRSRSGGRHTVSVDPSRRPRGVWKYPPMAAGTATDVADLRRRRPPPRSPDRLAVVEAGGREPDLGASSRTRSAGSPPGSAPPGSSAGTAC